MKTVKMFLTTEQHERLRAEAHRTGLKMNELVRRALDAAYPPPRHVVVTATSRASAVEEATS